MDELAAIKRLRSEIPGPDSAAKENLWERLEEAADTHGLGTDGFSGRSRRFVKVIIGLILVAVVAVSPAGSALAGRLGEVLGSESSREAIDEMNQKFEAYVDNRPTPTGSPDERRAATSRKLTEIVSEAAIKAGGGPVMTLPSWVVIHVPPRPLDEINRTESEAVCARVSELAPQDRTCELLEQMVQEGRVPPGAYGRPELERLFGDGG